MNGKLEKCPDPTTLVDFLLGKLPSEQIQSCQQHISICDPCVETIRGLKVERDTLNDLTRQAWIAAPPTPDAECSESQVVNDLIEKMQGLGEHETQSHHDATNNVLEDRAAEVKRLLGEPDIETDIGRIAQYRIVSLLGAGSTGVVYKAIDEPLQRPVALKILRPSLGQAARDRFIAEARATCLVNHPNVIPIYAVGEEGSLAYIAMQWLPGETLEQMLDRQESLPTDEVRKLGRQIAHGLQAAHANGLIHRDIKPANIWIASKDSNATILDFGLVRITDEDPQLTCTGMIAGTPCYMSPEQSRGQQLDGRSDLFSLGCVMYRSLTGRLPFRSDNALSTLQSIQRDQPTVPAELDPSIPQQMSDLTMCLLEKSPGRRPPTAEAVAAAIDSDPVDWPFVNPQPTVPMEYFKQATIWWKSIAALLAISLLAMSGFMFGPQIVRIVTNTGEIIIDTKVDDVQIEILRNGNRVRVIDLATEQAIIIKAGEYQILEMGSGNTVRINKNRLTLSRGEKEIVLITRADASARADEHVINPEFSFPIRTAPLEITESTKEISLDRGTSRRLKFPYPIESMLHAPKGIISATPMSQTEMIVVAEQTGECVAHFKSPQGNMQTITFKVTVKRHLIGAGDVLGVFIEGVLGNFDTNPPVHFPPPESGLPPSIGYPIAVEDDGTISLPLIKPIKVQGMTISSAKTVLSDAYTKKSVDGNEPILREGARIFVSLMRSRNYVPAIGRTTSTPPSYNVDLSTIIANNNERAVEQINRTILGLKIELEQASGKFAKDHPTVKALTVQIAHWQNYLAMTQATNQIDNTDGRSQQQFRQLQSNVFKVRADVERRLNSGLSQSELAELMRFVAGARYKVENSQLDPKSKSALLKLIELDEAGIRKYAQRKNWIINPKNGTQK